MSDSTSLAIRAATAADLGSITSTISLAFHDDPTWSWAFPDPTRRQEQYAAFWELMIRGALRYPWVLCTSGCEAVAVWIPPGATELDGEGDARLEPLLRELVGEHADDVLELLDRFDAAMPRGEPYYYLTLLATHPNHRGHGIGMQLLAESLRRIDAEHAACYLESSNPANDHRYARYGFGRIGAFHPPGSEITVSTMWRDAR
jgi:ribosomal protein S18 acetylase RimI-like enzyme